MKKKIFIISAALIGAIALAGCAASGAGQAAGTAQTVISGQTAAAKTISVEASESVKLEPDMASLEFGVDNQEATVEAVTETNTEAVSRVVEYLKGLGYEESSISTSDVGLYPQYDYSGGDNKLIGYRMDTTIALTDVPADKVSEVLSGALSQGVNTVNSISYYSSGFDEAYDEAVGKALELAQKKASAMAEKAGTSIKGIVSITEHTPDNNARYSASGSYMEYGAADGAVAEAKALNVTILPGTVEAEASVNVVYEIK